MKSKENTGLVILKECTKYYEDPMITRIYQIDNRHIDNIDLLEKGALDNENSRKPDGNLFEQLFRKWNAVVYDIRNVGRHKL